MYLLTEWEDWMGNYLASGLCILTKGQIFSCLAQPNSVNKNFII